MNSKKTLVFTFMLVALVQLLVPAKMIWDREDVLATGTEYKFKTAPIDPNDPFRGKYIILSYKADTWSVLNEKDWREGETIYVSFTKDNAGFAKIKSISRKKPSSSNDFCKGKVDFVTADGSNQIIVNFPFDRFYMEESKAYEAELAYGRSQLDTSKVTYASVNIKQGDAVLKDVLIDGVSLRELVKANQKAE
jgi:uncharacterized membrane-anchored protein